MLDKIKHGFYGDTVGVFFKETNLQFKKPKFTSKEIIINKFIAFIIYK